MKVLLHPTNIIFICNSGLNMSTKAYTEGIMFEVLINRALSTNEKRPELTNLMYSENGMSFSGFGTTLKHLEKTKKLLSKALKKMISAKRFDKDCQLQLKCMLDSLEIITSSTGISNVVNKALGLTNEYKELI